MEKSPLGAFFPKEGTHFPKKALKSLAPSIGATKKRPFPSRNLFYLTEGGSPKGVYPDVGGFPTTKGEKKGGTPVLKKEEIKPQRGPPKKKV